MNNKDFRSLFVKKKTVSIYEHANDRITVSGNDYLSIPSREALRGLSAEQRRVSATDFAILTGADTTKQYLTNTDKPSAWYYLTSQYFYNRPETVYKDGEYSVNDILYDNTSVLCPTFSLKLPGESVRVTLSQRLLNNNIIRHFYTAEDYERLYSLLENLSIQTNSKGEILYHTIELGQYPKNSVDNNLNNTLETLFNNGKLSQELKPTGLTYTMYNHSSNAFAPKFVPEFEYLGKKYVRVKPSASFNPLNAEHLMHDIQWVEVEPIKCKILNWAKLPKFINPKGSGIANTIELMTEDGLISGVPYFPQDMFNVQKQYFNSSIRGFINGLNLCEITNAVRSSIKNNDNFTCFSGLFNEAFNTAREPVYDYVIPNNQKIIDDYAFNGCVHLNSITLHPQITHIGENAFAGCNFEYIYKLDDQAVLSRNYPVDKNAYDIIKISELNQSIQKHLEIYLKNSSACITLSKKLNKENLVVPDKFLQEIAKYPTFNDFANGNFHFFKMELDKLLTKVGIDNAIYLDTYYKVAYALGCFSKEYIKDKNGKDTPTPLCQKASSTLFRLMNQYFDFKSLNDTFKNLSVDTRPNQLFVRFISLSNADRLPNVEMLIELEKNNKEIFAKTMSNFNKAIGFKKYIDEKGIPRKLSWEETFKKFYQYKENIETYHSDMEVMKVLGPLQLSNQVIEKVIKFRNMARNNNTPKNILGKVLKEETINEAIERIKNATRTQLINAKEELQKLCQKQFTYEFLDKYDPANAIIGTYCNCCANINSASYGSDIVKATMLSPDVQNLVIRDFKGDIIAKGAMYVNEEYGYAVLNDFEINEKYKTNEIMGLPGLYYTETNDEKEKEQTRNLIFKALQKGIRDFVKEYDKLHPDKPMQKVNVGLGFNRLREQCEPYETEENLLFIPQEYNFKDAEKEQKILYSRDAKTTTNTLSKTSEPEMQR